MNRLVSKFITMNKTMGSFAIKMGAHPSKTTVVPPPIDCARFRSLEKQKLRRRYGIPENRFVVGYHGRMTKHRGIAVLFQALEILKEKHDLSALLSMAPIEEDLTSSLLFKIIKEYELDDSVILMAGNNDPVNIYNLADVMVFPFISPEVVMSPALSVLEAMACESVVITSSFEGLGLRTFIKHGHNGFQISCDPEVLADYIGYLYTMPRYRLEEIGSKAREAILMHCSYPVVAESFIQVVNKVASRI